MIRWGAALIRVCSAFKNAQEDLNERLLRVKNYWIRVELQLKLVQNLACTLDEEHLKIQHETIEVFASKLKIAATSVEGAMQKNPKGDEMRARPWKYALFQQRIDKAIQDLELWQQLFDPSWYLIMRTAKSHIDMELKAHKAVSTPIIHDPITSAKSLREALHPAAASRVSVFLPEDGLQSLQVQSIPLCSAQMAQRGDAGKLLLLERVEPNGSLEVKQFEKDVRYLARKLAHPNPSLFGLLDCKGVIRHYDLENRDNRVPTAFTIVFRMPSGFGRPFSLRSYLQDVQQPDSLSDRFKLANELARSVSYIHTFDLVHKNIRPETILLLREEASPSLSTFMIGFDSFRRAEGQTYRRGVSAWEECLYQHSSRIGPTARQDYVMQHDIYSLGVVLLEIGLWKSFVEYDREGSPHPTSVSGSQDQFLGLARGKLKSIMGSIYSEVVVTCLTSLDPGNVDFGDESEFQDEDGIQVGVRYIEKVTSRLGQIQV